MIRKVFGWVTLGAFALLALPTAARAATWSTSAQYGSWQSAGYTLYNDVWGSGAGPQNMWANSGHNWGVWSEQPNTSGIKSYPDSSRYVGIPIDLLASVSSDFNVTVPSSGAQFETAYDIWAGNNQYEIMLWMNNYGNGPIASSYNCNGACASYTNVNVGGYTWNVYEGYTDHEVYSLVNTSQAYSGTVNILAVLKWLESQGLMSDPTLGAVQFGWEITSTVSGGENWTCNNYDVSYSSNALSFSNKATGMRIDGEWDTANGSNLGQWSASGSQAQQWYVQTNGDYLMIKNAYSSLYIDGMGRTAAGSAAGQWAYSGSSNQNWVALPGDGTNYTSVAYQNEATALLLDGGGTYNNGASVLQYGSSGSSNQKWYAVAP